MRICPLEGKTNACKKQQSNKQHEVEENIEQAAVIAISRYKAPGARQESEIIWSWTQGIVSNNKSLSQVGKGAICRTPRRGFE